MAVPSVQILSSATVRASWKSENRQIHRFLSYTFIRTPARYFRHGSRFSTVRTCLHSPEKASDGKYLGATRARALKSNYTHCVEVAESRVISNNTITRNNRVYQTRPAYTRRGQRTPAAPLHLFRPTVFWSGRVRSMGRLIHSAEASGAWLEIYQIFTRDTLCASSKCNLFLAWWFQFLACRYLLLVLSIYSIRVKKKKGKIVDNKNCRNSVHFSTIQIYFIRV